MKLAVLLLLFFPLSLADITAPSEFVSLAEMEDTLLKNLFQGYQRWVRPIQHVNDTIRVRFGLKISQLVDVPSSVAVRGAETEQATGSFTVGSFPGS